MNKLIVCICIMLIVACKNDNDSSKSVDFPKNEVQKNDFTFLNEFPDTLNRNSTLKNTLFYKKINNNKIDKANINDTLFRHYECLFVYNHDSESDISKDIKKLPLSPDDFDFGKAMVFLPKQKESIEFKIDLYKKGDNYLVFDLYKRLYYPTNNNQQLRIVDESSRYVAKIYVD